MINIKQYLEETNTVLLTKEAFEYLKERACVLDEIRAEISDFEEEVFQRPNTDYSDYAAVRHCLEIIDKYREGEEE